MNAEQNILAVPGKLQNSPSGKFILKIEEVIVEKIKYWKFCILDSIKQQVYNSEELFDIRHNTYFLWDSSDNVWIYSGDVGTFVWEQNNLNWYKRHYLEIDKLPPKFLVNKYPKIFSKQK